MPEVVVAVGVAVAVSVVAVVETLEYVMTGRLRSVTAETPAASTTLKEMVAAEAEDAGTATGIVEETMIVGVAVIDPAGIETTEETETMGEIETLDGTENMDVTETVTEVEEAVIEAVTEAVTEEEVEVGGIDLEIDGRSHHAFDKHHLHLLGWGFGNCLTMHVVLHI